MSRKMLNRLHEELHKYENSSVVVDFNGSVSTLKFYNKFNCYFDGSNNDILVLTGAETEDAVYIPVNKITEYNADIIVDNLLISLKGGIDLTIYQQ